MGQFFGNKQQSTSPDTQTGGIPEFSQRPDQSQIENFREVPDIIAPIWPSNSSLDINVYVSPSAILPKLRSRPKDSLVLQEKNFTLGDYGDSREIDTTITIPRSVQQNGTLWAHFLVGLTGEQLDPYAKGYSTEKAFHALRPLNQYLAKKKPKKLKNLLANEQDEEEDKEEDNTPDVQLVSYYHPNFTVSLVPSSGTMKYSMLQESLRQHIPLEATDARDISGQNGWHYPILFLNTFWQLKSHMLELNSTTPTVPLRLTLNNMAAWKFNLQSSLDDGSRQNARRAAFGSQTPGGGDGSEFELFKEILLNTNIYLLGTTGIVTVLHMLFETLAFKSDIVSNPHIPLINDLDSTLMSTSKSLTGVKRKT